MAGQDIAQTYVYALLREDGQTPFYIGVGRNGRWISHERDAHRKNTHKDHIIQKMHANGVSEIPKIKLMEGLTHASALQIEICLIQLIGRWPLGPLANLTSGGEGVGNPSQESREKKGAANVKSWKDQTVRERRITAIRAAWTPERRLAHSIAMKSRGPEWRKKVSEGRKESWFKKNGGPPKQRKPDGRSAYMKAAWANPETAPKRREGLKKAVEAANSELGIANRRISAKKAWANQEIREKMIASMKREISESERAKKRAVMMNQNLRAKLNAGNARPEVREKRIAAQKAAFATPESKARRSAAAKIRWAKIKDQKMLPSENENPSHRPKPIPNPEP